MAEQLEFGVILMVAGMGTVFVLLTVLVWLVHAVSKLSRWLEPPTAPSPAAAASSAQPDGELLSVIGAAVKTHRDRQASQRGRRE